VQRGGLVAFPTETVYGLGADALSADAVGRIFAAKGRPSGNPLIVHVADPAAARPLVADWPESAERLAQRFWPGPLTLVLPKSDRVPSVVTAGGATVALRVPAHPVALALLRASERVLAAPSANRSTRLSPTRAEHVRRDLDGLIDLILDAGPTPGGLESTVLDLTATPPRLLRPGLVSPGDIAQVIGAIEQPASASASGKPARSPGQLGRHYAPTTPLELVEDDGDRVRQRIRQGQRVGWLTFARPARAPDANTVHIRLPQDAAECAAQLYDVLHRLDSLHLDTIVVAMPPEGPQWLAIRDRLQRAAGRSS
jgi:L-threonylcarbamoyladenylate synthase